MSSDEYTLHLFKDQMKGQYYICYLKNILTREQLGSRYSVVYGKIKDQGSNCVAGSG
jgi:hypothetical protein